MYCCTLGMRREEQKHKQKASTTILSKTECKKRKERGMRVLR